MLNPCRQGETRSQFCYYSVVPIRHVSGEINMNTTKPADKGLEAMRRQLESDKIYLQAFFGKPDDMVVANLERHEYERMVLNATALFKKVDTQAAEITRLRELHTELLMEVDQKTPGETRHESAMRWLREYRKNGCTGTGSEAALKEQDNE